MLALLAPLALAAEPALVQVHVEAQIVRDGRTILATVGTHIRNGDQLTFLVTSDRDGYVNLLDYAPGGLVYTHCAPDEQPCLSERVSAGVPHTLGPFSVTTDAGWEIFDLVFTTGPVDPAALERFAIAGGNGTKSLGGGSVVGQHHVLETKQRNLPAQLQSWVTFALYHEQG